MSLVNAWAGAATSSSLRVVAKVTGSSTRLAVDTSASLADPVYFGPVTPDVDGIAHLEATGLDPDTRYWWAVEDDSVLDTAQGGQFRTHPPIGEPASFVFSAAGDAGLDPLTPGVAGSFDTTRISNHSIFDTVRLAALNQGHLFHVQLGDIHYYNPGQIIGNTHDDYRRCVDDVLLQPRQHELYRALPLVHIWDDHDYGPNDSDSTNPARATAWEVYRQREPHYPLASETEGIHHAFQVGRVQFVALDFRSFKTPKSATDDAAKTALGAGQKAWLKSILQTTTAEALVVLQQTVWTHTPNAGSDSWSGYDTERTELGNMFVETGWADRMVMIGADAHTLAMDTGASNLWGGFPHALFASMDASPSSMSSGFDLGISNAREQWGTVTINDDGDQITITMTGYQGASPWTAPSGDALTHSIVIDTADEPDPDPVPDPTPPPVAEAKIRDTVNFVGINDATGRIIADLPEMETGKIGRLLTAYASSKLTYPLVQSGPGGIPIETLLQATRPQRTTVVAIVNDLPVWGGRVLERVGGSAKDLTLPCVTSEQYLLNRLVTDREFVNTDRALVAQELLSDAGSIDQGPGMALEVDVTLTGDLIDRTYKASDQMTVYDALRALATGGLEWTIDLDYESAAGTVIRRIMRLGPRIGRVGVDVPLFESDGPSDSRYTLDENYTSDRYANAVSAYGTGQGEDLPQSATVYDQAALDSGAPVVHKAIHVRDTNDPVELLVIAQAELDRLKWGAELWALDSLFNAFPRLGFDAGLGDDVNWDLIGPRHPHGVEGAGRMIGWDLDLEGGRWSPKLLDPHDEEVV